MGHLVQQMLPSFVASAEIIVLSYHQSNSKTQVSLSLKMTFSIFPADPAPWQQGHSLSGSSKLNVQHELNLNRQVQRIACVCFGPPKNDGFRETGRGSRSQGQDYPKSLPKQSLDSITQNHNHTYEFTGFEATRGGI